MRRLEAAGISIICRQKCRLPLREGDGPHDGEDGEAEHDEAASRDPRDGVVELTNRDPR